MIVPFSLETVMVMGWELLDALMIVIVPVNVAVVAMSESPYFLYVTLTPRSSRALGEVASFWSFSQSYSQISVWPSLRVALLESTSKGAVIFQAMRMFLKASFIIFSVSGSSFGASWLASAFTLSAGFCGFV